MLSRVADSLYWMSRYLERAENSARLIDVHLNLLLESAPGITGQERTRHLLKSLDLRDAEIDKNDNLPQQLTFDAQHPASIFSCITIARENARQVREQISSEMWMQINKVYLNVKQTKPHQIWSDAPHGFFVMVKEGSHLFQGITDATMNHNQGWHFIQIGRYVERLGTLSSLLTASHRLLHENQNVSVSEQYFELVALLKSVTAFEAYCKVYNPNLYPLTIAEFLLFNHEFPHSARFCVDSLLTSLTAITEATSRHKNQRVNRIAGRLQSSLSFDDINDVFYGDFEAYLENLKQQAYLIHESLVETYINYSIESALT